MTTHWTTWLFGGLALIALLCAIFTPVTRWRYRRRR